MSSNSSKETRRPSFFPHLIIRKPHWVAAACALSAAASILYAVFNLAFLPNFAGLSDEQASYNRNYRAFVAEFRIEPDIIAVAKGPQPAENTGFLTALGSRLSANPSFERVFYKVDLTPFKAWALDYADTATLRKIEDTVKIAKPLFRSLDYRADLTRFWSEIPNMRAQKTNLQTSPDQLNALGKFVDMMSGKLEGKAAPSAALTAPFQQLQLLEKSQYITLKGGTYALLFARPAKNANIAQAVGGIRRTFAELGPRFPDVEAHLTGEPVLGVDEMQVAERDIFWAGLIALILSSSILVLGFGDFRKAVLTVITLLAGIGWSLGYIAASIGHLNVFTLSLFPMLIGLAIDFSIQFLGRYLEERGRRSSAAEAILKTYSAATSGLFSAALITALGFFAISLTQYKGIAELGVAMGGSLLLCFFSTIVVLPALLALTGDRPSRPSRISALFRFQADTQERRLLAHSKAILLISLFLTILFAHKARRIRFDHNVLDLQSKSTDSVKTELELLSVSGKSSLFAVLVADNIPQARRYINEIERLDTVGSVQSPLAFLPREQTKKFPYLNQIQKEMIGFKILPSSQPVNVPRLESSFEKIRGMVNVGQNKLLLAGGALQLLENFLFPGSQVFPGGSLSTRLADLHAALDRLQAGVNRFLGDLKNADPQTAQIRLTDLQSELYGKMRDAVGILKSGVPPRPITLEDLPREVRDQFVGKSGKILIQVYPSQNIWNRPALESFISQLREVDPNVTGSPVLILETTRAMLESYKAAAKIAIAVIVLVAFAQFRKPGFTVLTLTPLAIGLIWLMGIMVYFHKSFNPANLLTLPIVLGIGVAFGVYVINRYREERHPAIFSTSTGRSVLLSALTSIAGFASLLGVSHQGLQSLGFTMTVGLSVITLCALVILPALLEILGSFRNHSGENRPHTQKSPRYPYPSF